MNYKTDEDGDVTFETYSPDTKKTHRGRRVKDRISLMSYLQQHTYSLTYRK